ncbi:MAG: ABC transporter permease [Acidobacteriaceae bacterium]|nr:ABC transporter permease [Acidobacteriaceae bacterium]
MKVLADSYYLTLRGLRHLLRQPWYVALTLVQPIIQLVFYGQLFQKVVELPGFHAASYIDFLTPGIVVMSALFSAGWTGMGLIVDMDRGVIDRFLVAPVSRASIIVSRLMGAAFVTVVQSLILFGLGALLGARYPSGIGGFFILLIAAMLISIPIGALSCALGLTLRKSESVIGAANFVLLPLVFMSPVFMATALMPDWMRAVARFNPVKWSVEAGRIALSGHADWSAIVLRLGCLFAFSLLAGWVATRAFRGYQISA